MQSSGLVDQARAIVSRYNLITLRFRDVSQAVDNTHGDVSSELLYLVRSLINKNWRES